MDEMYVSYSDGSYRLINQKEQVVYPLAAGSRFQLWLGGCWSVVELVQGEYKGWYYRREDGTSERLALSMRARFCN